MEKQTSSHLEKSNDDGNNNDKPSEAIVKDGNNVENEEE